MSTQKNDVVHQALRHHVALAHAGDELPLGLPAVLADVALAFDPDGDVATVHGQVAVFDPLGAVAQRHGIAAQGGLRGGTHDDVVGGRRCGVGDFFDVREVEHEEEINLVFGEPAHAHHIPGFYLVRTQPAKT